MKVGLRSGAGLVYQICWNNKPNREHIRTWMRSLQEEEPKNPEFYHMVCEFDSVFEKFALIPSNGGMSICGSEYYFNIQSLEPQLLPELVCLS